MQWVWTFVMNVSTPFLFDILTFERKKLTMAKKARLKKKRLIFWGSLFPFLLFVPLLYVIANLTFGFSWPDVTELIAYVPYPERLHYPNGIKELIKALGLVGFALSYVNSAKASRVKGILLEDVIFEFYHFYGMVFLIHGLFALLGLYSCEINLLRSAWICLFGMILCTIYSLIMAYEIVFSPKRQNYLIAEYINVLLSKSLPLKRRRQTAYQLGRYIGERYQADSIELGRHIDNDHGDQKMLLSTLRLLMPELSEIEQVDTQALGDISEETWEGALPEVFDRMYSYQLTSHPEYALFTLAAQQGHAFQDDVRHCATLWDNLLLPVEREGRQAELVVDVLWYSQKTSALCCGLVYCLYTTHIQYHNKEDGWLICTDFLSRVSNIARAFHKPQQYVQREKVLRCCMDMMLLFFCLACLHEANSQGVKPTPAFRDLQDLIDNEYQRNSSAACYIPIDQLCFTKYLYFAHALFQLLAMPRVNLPYRSELYWQTPDIVAAMEQSFRRKTYFT